ncbi:hypothetical protein EMMF5_006252 [Cystobasidiomycetes sp. EMM_F5]
MHWVYIPTVLFLGIRATTSRPSLMNFPADSVNRDLFTDSQTHTTCGWKGVASYYNAKLPDGSVISKRCGNADKAKNIEGYVAFYKNKVEIKA